MKSFRQLFLAVTAAFLLTSCVSVEVFEENPSEGGDLVVNAFFKDKDGPEAREKLAEVMRSNCAPNDYKIVSKHFVKSGTRTSNQGESRTDPNSTHHVANMFGDVSSYRGGKRTTSRSSSTTKNTYDWHVKYKCVK